MEFLASLDDDTLMAAMLDSLAQNTHGGKLDRVERHQLVYTALLSVAGQTGWSSNDAVEIEKKLNDAYLDFRAPDRTYGDSPDVRRIETALWTLINSGIVYPRLNIPKQVSPVDPSNPPWVIQHLYLTAAGRKVVQSGAPHPYRPDFVQSVLATCIDLPDEAVARLEDAHDCWRSNLPRAGVVMLGLAFECVARVIFDTERVLDKLAHNPKLQKKCEYGTAKAILEGLREALTLNAKPKQPAEADLLAVTVADDVRLHRNMAAHDWKEEFSSRAKMEELLIFGGRKLPEFWDIRHRV
ncbi:MAG: hypothetical protein ACOY3Y_07820 [Acidobacteriota bacterium]